MGDRAAITTTQHITFPLKLAHYRIQSRATYKKQQHTRSKTREIELLEEGTEAHLCAQKELQRIALVRGGEIASPPARSHLLSRDHTAVSRDWSAGPRRCKSR